jgi:hypothetical protein
VALLDELAIRRVEDRVIKVFEGDSRFGILGHWLEGTSRLFAETRVAVVECSQIGGDRLGAVNLGILRREIGLVKVVGVGHVRSMYG